MNTRLQVEHPVTELVTGIDIVAEQVRDRRAASRSAYGQDDVRMDGHAIECRVYAEDADAGFLPAIGRLALVRFPAGDGIRVDHGVVEGQDVSASFDPMIAKVCALRRDARRGDRAARATRCGATVLLGTVTNTAFLERVLAHPAFARGRDAHRLPGRARRGAGARRRRTTTWSGAWSRRPRWRRRASTCAWRRASRSRRWAGGGREPGVRDHARRRRRRSTVDVARHGGSATVTIDGRDYHGNLRPAGDGYELTLEDRTEPMWIVVDGDTVHVHAFGRSWELEVIDPVEQARAGGASEDVAVAPMPGTVDHASRSRPARRSARASSSS